MNESGDPRHATPDTSAVSVGDDRRGLFRRATRARVTVRLMLASAIAALVSGCAGPELKDYRDSGPPLDLVAFFEGETRAWGQFQDRFGKVRRRFVVDITGTWDGKTLMLSENFRYDDGALERRVWTLTRSGDATWEGHADGVVGKASGVVAGNAFNWKYTFDLKTGTDKTLRVHFDDWMWRQDEDVVINRAYVTKFGINVGEVLIFFRKEPRAVAAAS